MISRIYLMTKSYDLRFKFGNVFKFYFHGKSSSNFDLPTYNHVRRIEWCGF